MGFLIFAAPLLTGIFNLGNGVGMAFFAIVEVIVLFWERLKPLLEIKAVRIIAAVITAVLGVLFVLACAISVYMIKCADNPPDKKSIAVVLGCRVKGEVPSLMLGGRIKAAYGFLAENPDALCIVSGGQGEDEFISEADCMYNELVKMGISPDRLIKENQSTDTFENIRNSSLIIDRLKTSGIIDKDEEITIITNEYHQCRAMLIAKKQGINTKSISCRSTIWLLPTYWVRECFGVAFEIAFK